MDFTDYLDCNFIVVANLEKMRISEGMLQLKLNFKENLDNKLILIWMPVQEKKLIIDKNLDVSIE